MKFLIALLLSAVILLGQQPPPLPPPNPPVIITDEVSLQWDPSPDAGVASYRIYYGTNSGVYWNYTNAGPSTNLTVTNLLVGSTYYFAATAVGTNAMESDLSNEVVYSVPQPKPQAPSGLALTRVPVYVLDVRFSDIPGVWQTNQVIRLVIDASKDWQFFSVSNHIETVEGIRLR